MTRLPCGCPAGRRHSKSKCKRELPSGCGHRITTHYHWTDGAWSKWGGGVNCYPDWIGTEDARVVCDDCGKTLPLGPASDTPATAIEVRAAEIYDALLEGGCEMSSSEIHGFNDTPMRLRNGAPIEIVNSSTLAGYLARCIAEHAAESGE